jgi:nitroreductase
MQTLFDHKSMISLFTGLFHPYFYLKSFAPQPVTFYATKRSAECGIMLTAKAMGYDSCPMIGFDPEKVAEIIRLPKDYVISFMIAVGKAVQPARPRGGQLDLSEVMIQNQF